MSHQALPGRWSGIASGWWPPTRFDNGIIAFGWGLVGYLATWAAIIVICAVDADGETAVLPSPSSWTMRGIMLFAALCSAVWGYAAAVRAARSGARKDVRAWAAANTALVLAVVAPTFLFGVVHERQFVSHLPAGTDSSTALVDGRRACHWLAAQHWGRSPGPEHLSGVGGYTAILYRPPGGSGQGGSNSTSRLAVYYLRHVNSLTPEPLSTSAYEQAIARFTALAWSDLCPFQYWIHRPKGGGND
ncbi:MAG: hypothetical protein WBV37_14650 [Nocardioidaceae bacterium]